MIKSPMSPLRLAPEVHFLSETIAIIGSFITVVSDPSSLTPYYEAAAVYLLGYVFAPCMWVCVCVCVRVCVCVCVCVREALPVAKCWLGDQGVFRLTAQEKLL